MSQPPPPPPHGGVPKPSGLGPGNYDIFVIPQRDKGAGFIYLPSLQPNINSFAAGFASALVLVALFQSMAPAFQAWWNSFQGMGTMGMSMLVVAVGVGAWAWGRSQIDAAAAAAGGTGGGMGGGSTAGGQHGPGGFGGTSPGTNPGSPPDPGPPPPPPPPHNHGPPPSTPGSERPKPSWQRPQPPPPQPGTTRTEAPKGAWEKAREETRRREEERKAREEEEKRKAATAQRLRELREKEAREREQREREARERREKQEKLEKEIREKEELKQKLEQERQERIRLEKEKAEREAEEKRAKEEAEKARERAEKEKEEARKREEARKKEAAEAAEREARKGSTYAYSGVGERTNPWPNGKPPAPPPPPPPASSSSASPTKPAPSTASSTSTSKRPPAPTAKTYLDPEDEAYSYRPYDTPKKPTHRKAPSSVGSDFSWAQSHSTARTTPPPSMRGPYTTKDPDKIVIKAVYLFMNQFAKTPASQLVAGVGTVTDGLILRITTEGLFIDDDLRGVPQREWDVKAWTLKLVEVWCPQHCLNCNSAPPPASNSANHPPNLFAKMASQRARAADRGATKTLTGDEADALLTETLRACKSCCRLGLSPNTLKNTNVPSSAGQNGEWKTQGLHILRATIRDQEGKRYMFVMDQEESWKVSVGLQRMRKGTQAQKSLGVSSMSAMEARNTLELLGWSA